MPSQVDRRGALGACQRIVSRRTLVRCGSGNQGSCGRCGPRSLAGARSHIRGDHAPPPRDYLRHGRHAASDAGQGRPRRRGHPSRGGHRRCRRQRLGAGWNPSRPRPGRDRRGGQEGRPTARYHNPGGTEARAARGKRSGVHGPDARTSGRYFDRVVLPALGIASEVHAKAKLQTEGSAAEFVRRGEADIAIQQISELLAVDGVTVVGTLPAPLQKISTYSAAIATQRAGAGARPTVHRVPGHASQQDGVQGERHGRGDRALATGRLALSYNLAPGAIHEAARIVHRRAGHRDRVGGCARAGDAQHE